MALQDSNAFQDAVARLKAGFTRLSMSDALGGDSRDAEVNRIRRAQDCVITRYRPLFAPDRLSQLSADEFRSFLHFKNNQHWSDLQRRGSTITSDMPQLQKALAILLDETLPIEERLNTLVPLKGPAFVPFLGRAVLTPILLVAYPERYGVLNQVSENGLTELNLWPAFDRGVPFGEEYQQVNAILSALAKAVGTDLWTLDSLLWRVQATDSPLLSSDSAAAEPVLADESTLGSALSPGAILFGIEKHLHEFLRDNWENTSLGRDWEIYKKDGEEVGFEYKCTVGRIDLLCHHRKKPAWLVVELKRGQTGDATVGQVLRYMGWVKTKLAVSGETVEGLIIAHEADEPLRYALEATQSVKLNLYEVEFRLRPNALQRD